MRWNFLSLALFLSVTAASACDMAQEMASPAEGAVTQLSHQLRETTGQVDLYSAEPQTVPSGLSEIIYNNLPKKMSLQRCNADTLVCKYQLVNFYCERKGVQGFEPSYTCSYGKSGQIPDAESKAIYKALMDWGFVSDCDREFLQHCELDPMESLECTSTPTADPKKQNFSCTIEL